MNRYCARICWNSNGWVFPSGEAKELEKGSYVTESGFGHEEWLFNFAWLIDGYHYAFLQPVNDSFDKVVGKTLEILLYSINPTHDRVYVGEIRNCHVLALEQAEKALKYYEKAGWSKSMRDQVIAIGGDAARLFGDAPFNVRFRPSDADMYQPLRAARQADRVTKLNRYTLVEADQPAVKMQWRRRKGTRTPPTIQSIIRSGQPIVMYDPVHAALQGRLFDLLKARFGDNVCLEADFVDITISGPKKKVLVEIKSDADARVAIRKALGQILEYAYFNTGLGNEDAELFIVAPGPTTTNVSDYLKCLRTKFGMPVTYCTFSLADGLPNVFVACQEYIA